MYAITAGFHIIIAYVPDHCHYIGEKYNKQLLWPTGYCLILYIPACSQEVPLISYTGTVYVQYQRLK